MGPGAARIGLIALQLPPVSPDAKKTQPTVLKILFPDRSRRKSDRHTGAVDSPESKPWNPSTRQSGRCTSVCG